MSAMCFIAVSYFGSKDLKAYIETLVNQTDSRWSLKIVDNSQDEEESLRLRELTAEDPRIEVWASGSNLGYFGAAEWARNRMTTSDFDWIAVTNTDVVLATDDFVQNILGSCDATAAVLAPAIHGSSSRSALNPYMYARPTVARSRMRRLLFWNVATARITVVASYLRHRIAKRQRTTPNVDVEIYAAHGSFIIFGRRFFAEQGDFRHTSFLFGEELTVAEFCRVQGIRTVFSPRLQVVHTEHAHTGVLRSREVLESQVGAAKNALKLISSNNSR
jgi:GT2 family glycosyltransferase